jgi:hypothetical protein
VIDIHIQRKQIFYDFHIAEVAVRIQGTAPMLSIPTHFMDTGLFL